jgi:hypothetical protein
MNKCPNNKTKFLNLFSIKLKHQFVITNAFSTINNYDIYDVVKTCKDCEKKEAFSIDRSTLKESLKLYPNAFEESVRDFLRALLS